MNTAEQNASLAMSKSLCDQERLTNPRFTYGFSILIHNAFCEPKAQTKRERKLLVTCFNEAVRNGFICC